MTDGNQPNVDSYNRPDLLNRVHTAVQEEILARYRTDRETPEAPTVCGKGERLQRRDPRLLRGSQMPCPGTFTGPPTIYRGQDLGGVVLLEKVCYVNSQQLSART